MRGILGAKWTVSGTTSVTRIWPEILKFMNEFIMNWIFQLWFNVPSVTSKFLNYLSVKARFFSQIKDRTIGRKKMSLWFKFNATWDGMRFKHPKRVAFGDTSKRTPFTLPFSDQNLDLVSHRQMVFTGIKLDRNPNCFATLSPTYGRLCLSYLIVLVMGGLRV